MESMHEPVRIVDYDPIWPDVFDGQAARIRTAMGERALRIEHVGSTAVPGLAAKPVIDIVLVVADSAAEQSYLPELEAAGYRLRIREPAWFGHRMFKGAEPEVNLHVFPDGCPEIDRMLMFREWLRGHASDRDLYARTKLSLAQKMWADVQDYADAKTGVVEAIMARARTSIAPDQTV